MAGKLQPPLLKALAAMKYEHMTEVQHKVLKDMGNIKSDALVQAKTGTGKTIAFLLPALQNLLTAPQLPDGQVGILIISPTRELAVQIAKECDQLTASLSPPVDCHTAFGGTAKLTRLAKFMKGKPAVLVATPGRLVDYLSDPDVAKKFEDVRTVILDEADTMLEAGHLISVQKILKQIPPKSKGWQGLCFSATLPSKVKDVVHHILAPGYKHISTIDKNEPPTTSNVPQHSIIIPDIRDTFSVIHAFLQSEYEAAPADFKAIVFSSTANKTRLLYDLYLDIIPQMPVYQMQSRMSQGQRTRTTDEFKKTKKGILFASDVVGRGMDFPNVGLVAQVGLPSSSEQYIHRVGRTARAGNSGRATILLTKCESLFLAQNRQLPITPHPESAAIHNNAQAVAPQLLRKLQNIDYATKSKAYMAWLGFNATKLFKGDKIALVNEANAFSEGMGYEVPPELSPKAAGMMGLKGIPGVRVEGKRSQRA
ncbi:DEAD-domain-containing protein [Venturia nashicola]|uniref:ATP-dependent RNA helicase n=1 Tax=Venturia nashicola TaxID=86259 RepID=A0A4Z1NV47_9PEZI|nr:DEAD-domain-containing protein [Venturia nashicola]TLD20908.1 DEAD-domain-containing protein [Venturia nashicola]